MATRFRAILRTLATGVLLKTLGRLVDLRRTRSGKLYIEGKVKNRESKYYRTLKRRGFLIKMKSDQ